MNTFEMRTATVAGIPSIESLLKESARTPGVSDDSPAQIEGALEAPLHVGHVSRLARLGCPHETLAHPLPDSRTLFLCHPP